MVRLSDGRGRGDGCVQVVRVVRVVRVRGAVFLAPVYRHPVTPRTPELTGLLVMDPVLRAGLGMLMARPGATTSAVRPPHVVDRRLSLHRDTR